MRVMTCQEVPPSRAAAQLLRRPVCVVWIGKRLIQRIHVRSLSSSTSAAPAATPWLETIAVDSTPDC